MTHGSAGFQPAPTHPASPHKGWHSRGYLPHFDNPTLVQMVTFRLADSLPASTVIRWKAELQDRDDAQLRKRIEQYLDAGYGACYLRDPSVARLVENSILHFDDVRYYLLAWVVMPNHVHLVIETRESHPLHDVVHSWKSYTSNRANELLKRTGAFWQPEYYDRFIRNEAHLHKAIHYIHENPVKAGLAEQPEEWMFSSARFQSGCADAGWKPALPG